LLAKVDMILAPWRHEAPQGLGLPQERRFDDGLAINTIA
jgi:hypothetical protein